MVYASRLDSSRGEIRLIRIVIHESDESDPYNRIECSLQTVSLDSNPEYHALSYEWGSASHDYEDKFKTTVNGENVHLHWNLVEALWNMRKDLNELLWIDGISINQRDEDEKAGQVTMMGEVYKKAKAVRVWVGPFGATGELGMDLLAEAEDFVRTHSDGEYVVDGQMRRPLQHWLRDRIDVPELAKHWDSFFNICERSYWMRCWIIQEVVLSASAILFCGERKVSLETFFEISNESLRTSFETIRTSSRTLPFWLNKTRKVFHLFGARAVYLSSLENRREIDRLIWDFQSSYCTVPRDRFYCLLGIAKPYPGSTLLVDYKYPETDVYKDVARYIIRGSKKLDILALGYEHYYCGHKMPSWVPDWTDRPGEMVFSDRSEKQWSAGGLSFQTAEFLEEEEVLRVDAMILGEIYSFVETTDVISTEMATNVIRNLVDFACSDPAKLYSDEQSKAESIEAVIATIYELYKLLFTPVYLKAQLDRNWPWADFAKFVQRIGAPRDNDTIPISHEQYLMVGHATRNNKRYFKLRMPAELVTTYNRIVLGQATHKLEIGDVAAVVVGCRYPLVLRPLKHSSGFRVIGEAYVQGVMNGEALRALERRSILIR